MRYKDYYNYYYKLNETVPVKCEYENHNWHQISRNGQINLHSKWKTLATAVLVYYWKLQEHNVRIYEGQQQREEEEFFLWLGHLDLWFPQVICVSQLFNKNGGFLC